MQTNRLGTGAAAATAQLTVSEWGKQLAAAVLLQKSESRRARRATPAGVCRSCTAVQPSYSKGFDDKAPPHTHTRITPAMPSNPFPSNHSHFTPPSPLILHTRADTPPHTPPGAGCRHRRFRGTAQTAAPPPPPPPDRLQMTMQTRNWQGWPRGAAAVHPRRHPQAAGLTS